MGGGGADEHLLITLNIREPVKILDQIRKDHPELRITLFKLEPGTKVPDEIWADVTILVTLGALPPKPELAPKLVLIHFTSAGTNHIIQSPIYTSTDITLTTSSGIHGPMISEWVLMTSLVSSHLYNTMHDWQKEHRWGKNGKFISQFLGLQDNVGKRFAVLGYGSIGRQTARVAKAMGMDVIAYTASPRETKESKKDTGFIVPGTGDPEGDIPSAWYSGLDKKSLHNFLAQDIDHLLISVPLTDDTERLLGAEEFEILGREKRAFISNISRGQIVKQDDLIVSLKQGADKESENGLRGAALDVTDPEPLPADSELWDAPNCIVTPHISGLSAKYTERSFQVLQVNLAKRAKGKKLINVVNRKKGY